MADGSESDLDSILGAQVAGTPATSALVASAGESGAMIDDPAIDAAVAAVVQQLAPLVGGSDDGGEPAAAPPLASRPVATAPAVARARSEPPVAAVAKVPPHTNSPLSSPWTRLWLGFAVVLVAALLGAYACRRPAVDLKYTLVRGFHYALPCQVIAGDEIRGGSTLDGAVLLAQLRDDLLVHLHATDLPLLCAQHVGLPLCYCVKRTYPLAPNVGPKPPRNAYEELFNPSLYYYKDHLLHKSHEQPLECEHDYWTDRFDVVGLEYQDSAGDVAKVKFDGPEGDVVQYALEVLLSLPSHCGAASYLNIVRAGGAQNLVDRSSGQARLAPN